MSWNRFKKYYLNLEKLGFSLDVSRMDFDEEFIAFIKPKMKAAFSDMKALEAGAVANPDEKRMVGHYWLRTPALAPEKAITQSVNDTLGAIKAFAQEVHGGKIRGATGNFSNLLIIGIGGSALGPQFVAQALGQGKNDKMRLHFLDNTDPDGMDVVLSGLADSLGQTLCVVISKSGGTPETRNGMLETAHAYANAGLNFAEHAVAVTGDGSNLDKKAVAENWLKRFPMWDWVGGRTSETGPVGLLPAALQGLDIDEFLDGAAAMDAATRVPKLMKNPAALLAAMWYYATDGVGSKDMVILPYKDRLGLFSKYLQQLVMESLGKELDLEGNVVNQGITVYGNKGSTDQHAYVQQLREGVLNFFITFIEVLKDREGASIEIEGEPLTTSGDFLLGFLLGSRDALYEMGRESITITVNEVNAPTVGALIALYERAVGLYASLVGINAYHQPGVEAGKKAARTFLNLNHLLHSYLRDYSGHSFTIDELADALGLKGQNEIIFKLLEHLSANPEKCIVKTNGSSNVFSAKYSHTK